MLVWIHCKVNHLLPNKDMDEEQREDALKKKNEYIAKYDVIYKGMKIN